LNNWIYFILVFSTIVVLGPLLIEKASAFTVTVNLSDKPFGDSKVWIEAKGPNGYDHGDWYIWSSIRTGVETGTVTLNLPDSAFPTGEEYRICASSKAGFNLIIPNCVRSTITDGNAALDISLR
jgi:hypothetical protein